MNTRHLYQPTLFEPITLQGKQAFGENNLSIDGLSYLPDFITPAEEHFFLKNIDAGVWLTDLKRRVQHYGYKYDYKSRRIDQSMLLGALPDWLGEITAKLRAKDLFNGLPDQVIVNEYLPGQGISAHIDCEPCFSDTIISLSLGSTACMDFTKGTQKHTVFLERRSIVILKQAARNEWYHSIPARKKDLCGMAYIKRTRRVSLTFRKVII